MKKRNMQNLLVTGGAGFIGCNFVKMLLEDMRIDDLNLVVLDNLSYCGNLQNLDFARKYSNYCFIKGDICDRVLLDKIFAENEINGVINFAAESHVDRSIHDSEPFLRTNVGGTLALLDMSVKHKVKKYLQVSTDEVYGSLSAAEPAFTEQNYIKPRSPYSASKASADHFVMAYYATHDLPVVITRCSNNYGPNQFPEKLIPLMVFNAMEDKDLPIYGDGRNIRDWVYVGDHCAAIWNAFESGNVGEVYNVGGNCELTNLQIVTKILDVLGKPESLIKYVADRPGHDRRYAMNSDKITRELGWKPKVGFEEGFAATIEWYKKNYEWCRKIRSGEYLEYYRRQYENI